MIRASGPRTGYAALPGPLRAAMQDMLGEPVVSAVSQSGGFSPGSADRVVLASGRTAFIKAVGSAPSRHAITLHRREARIAALLPASLPAPRFLGAIDTGDWVALAFQDIAGSQPAALWEPGQLHRALDTLAAVAGWEADRVPGFLPTTARAHAAMFAGWERLLADRMAGPWSTTGLEALAALAARSAAALEGRHLQHGDVRADNMLIDDSGALFLVDWPHACRGPAWFDALTLLVNAATLDPGFDPEPWLGGHRIFAGADPGQLTAVLAGLAGYFMDAARNPAPDGLPTLRAFQELQGNAVLRWLENRGVPVR